MKIDLKWDKPIRLRDGSRVKQIYQCKGLERVPNKPGIYIFARSFGKHVAPLYIGQALRLKDRIYGQFNNLHLMLGLQQAETGHRFLIVARLKLHPGQQKERVLNIVESAFIKHALSEGHDLLNQQGTKTHVHAIRSKGSNLSRKFAPRAMYVERKRVQ